VRAAVIALAVNIALDAALMPALGAVGIALATAAAAWLNAALLAFGLARRGAWSPEASRPKKQSRPRRTGSRRRRACGFCWPRTTA